MQGKPQKGFSLMEFMITIMIIVLLAAIAIPAYINYTRRAYYSDIITATAPWKLATAKCFQTLGTLTKCNANSNHIPANLKTATNNIANLSVNAGIITITPVAAHGVLTSDTCTLTPSMVNSAVVWTASGPSVTNGYTE